MTSDKLLKLAAQNGNISLTKLLLEKGADARSKDPSGRCPIHAVSASLHSTSVSVVRLLLEFGADIDERDIFFWVPLHLAAQFGDLPLTRFLLEKGAKVNSESITDDQPIHMALHAPNHATYDVIKLLLKHGAALNCANSNSDRPLHLAIRKGQPLVVELLLKSGSDVNDFGYPSGRPIHVACKGGSLESVRMLLDHGVDVNGVEGAIDGYQPLHVAAGWCELPGLIDLLVSRGAVVDTECSRGLTALALACANGRLTNVKDLLAIHI